MLGFATNSESGSNDDIHGLREMVSKLQKRVKELEEGEADTVSSSRTPSLDESEELHQVKKQLAQVRDEKAKQELDFMNQMSSIAAENHGAIDKLRQQLETSERQAAELQEKAESADSLKDNCIALDKQLQDFRNVHISEMKKVKEDLHGRMKEMQLRVSDLENEKVSLLEEVSEIRVQLADEGKVATTVKSELQGMTGKHELELERLKAENSSKDETIELQQHEMGELNDSLIEMEGQKASLLDEIVRLKKQVERESKRSVDLQAAIDDLNAKVCLGENQRVEQDAMEEWAKASEEKAERLESELAEVRDSHESEISRIEFALDECEKELEETQEELQRVNKEAKEELRRAEDLAADYKQQIEEREVELGKAREALMDESGKTDTIASELRTIIEQKQSEIDRLQRCVECEQEIAEKLHTEVQDLKKKLNQELVMSGEKDAELLNLATQREAYERRTSQNIMEQVTEVDSLRAQNSAMYEEIQNLNKKLESESDAAAKMALELSTMRGSSPNPPKTSTARSLFRSEPSPPSTPKIRRISRSTSGYDSPPPMNSPARTPVRQVAAYFEREAVKNSSFCSAPCNSSFVASDEVARDYQDLETKLEKEREHVRILEEKVKHDSILVGELRAEIAALTATNSSSSPGASWREFEKRNKEDQQQIEDLTSQVAMLQEELDTERTLVKRLKADLSEFRCDGSISSNSSAERAGPSRKAHPWTPSRKDRRRDAEITSLKDTLASTQIANADMERDYSNKVKSLEDCIEVMEKEMETELKSREDEIDSLQKKLDWQTEEISRLEMERSELCSNMDGLSSAQNDELSVIKAQLKEKNAENAVLLDKINELKSQLKGDNRAQEVEYWKQKVKDTEERERMSTRARMNHVRSLDEMKAENEKLKASVRDLTVERKKMQERVKSSRIDSSAGSSSRRKDMERSSRRSAKQGSISRVEI